MNARRTAPTELEFCVLGAIWRDGPCSAYAVQREFAGSSSSHWSASAGSIYPVMKRLEALGLIKARVEPWGRRGKKHFLVTAKGERNLKIWIGALPEWTGRPTMDPIRTRMNFLAVLDGRAAPLRFIERAMATTRSQLLKVTRKSARQKEASSPVAYLTTLGSLYELRARLEWLREARKVLKRAGLKAG